MTPVANMNLEQYLERNPRPGVEDPIYGWFGCLAAGLDYFHQRKIKHRDIKPANILISNGCVLYADFGIAKMSRTKPLRRLLVMLMRRRQCTAPRRWLNRSPMKRQARHSLVSARGLSLVQLNLNLLTAFSLCSLSAVISQPCRASR